jgi:NADH:ubiquinone oxidoreductase subunit 2 (subunit N)
LFSAAPKIILLGVTIKLSFVIFSDFKDSFTTIFSLIGISSVCFASVVALYQKRIKRLLAYSTISHTGFLLLALSCGSIDSVKSCVFYIFVYVVMSMAFFSSIMLSGYKNNIKYLIN